MCHVSFNQVPACPAYLFIAFTTNLGVLRAYAKPDPHGMVVFEVQLFEKKAVFIKVKKIESTRNFENGRGADSLIKFVLVKRGNRKKVRE